jgi:transcriptional regulator with XRE-family HTH domain
VPPPPDGAAVTEVPVADEVEPAPSVAEFGRWLRQERELRGLSVDEVARLTRLTRGVVEGLESGEASRMPPHGYVYGYLRTYATAVGLDADDVVLRWQEVEATEPASPLRRTATDWRPVLIAIAVAVAIAAGVFLAN